MSRETKTCINWKGVNRKNKSVGISQIEAATKDRTKSLGRDQKRADAESPDGSQKKNIGYW